MRAPATHTFSTGLTALVALAVALGGCARTPAPTSAAAPDSAACGIELRLGVGSVADTQAAEPILKHRLEARWLPYQLAQPKPGEFRVRLAVKPGAETDTAVKWVRDYFAVQGRFSFQSVDTTDAWLSNAAEVTTQARSGGQVDLVESKADRSQRYVDERFNPWTGPYLRAQQPEVLKALIARVPLPPKRRMGMQSTYVENTDGEVTEVYYRTYLMKMDGGLSNADLKLARSEGPDPSLPPSERARWAHGQPHVSLILTKEGAKRFTAFTTQNIQREVAVSIDDTVYSVPVIMEAITGGQMILSSPARDKTDAALRAEVAAIVDLLNSGPLPVRPKVLSMKREACWK